MDARCASPPATVELVIRTAIVKADWCKSDCGQTNGLCVSKNKSDEHNSPGAC